MKLNKSLVSLTILLSSSMASNLVYGQDASSGNLGDMFTTLLLVSSAVVILAGLGYLLKVANMFIQIKKEEVYRAQGLEHLLEKKDVSAPKEDLFTRIWRKLEDAVPVEHEEDIIFEHEYDGIRELDNNLPPWWLAMFYISIAFAVVYLTYYHFTDQGPSSREEYAMEMAKAEADVEAYLAAQSNLIDENTVTQLLDEESLATGKAVFLNQCATCHGQLGEGGVGPNMTDDYYIHGNTIKDIFKTIKYGVPEKGMISWKAQLRPGEMQAVASYIMSLHGTNPPNPKEPQGEKLDPVNAESQGEESASESEG